MSTSPSTARPNRRRANQRGVVVPAAPQASPFIPRSRFAAVVAEEEGPDAKANQVLRSTILMTGLVVVVAGVCWLVLALLRDRVVGGQWTGGGAAAVAIFFGLWALAPFTPAASMTSAGGASKGQTNKIAALACALIVVVLATALALLSRTMPGGLAVATIGSLCVAAVIDLAMIRLPAESAWRFARLFVPIGVAALLLYIPPATSLGALLAPIAPLPVGIGAAIAVALLLQDQLGSSAARYRHASGDTAGVALTRLTEVSRSLWLLVLDALGFGVEDDVGPTKQ